MIDVGLLHAGVAKVIIVLAKKWMGCFVRRAGHSGTQRDTAGHKNVQMWAHLPNRKPIPHHKIFHLHIMMRATAVVVSLITFASASKETVSDAPDHDLRKSIELIPDTFYESLKTRNLFVKFYAPVSVITIIV